VHHLNVAWEADFHDSFVPEYHGLPQGVQDELLACVILCGGDKSGGSERRFYVQLIARADPRFESHLAKIKKPKQKEKERKSRR
jgi:hypothetical protein